MGAIPDETQAILRSNGIVAYPTSTLPGLATLPTSEALDGGVAVGAGFDGRGGGVAAVIGATGVDSTTSEVVVASNISEAGLAFAA